MINEHINTIPEDSTEQFLSPKQIALRWNVHPKTVIRAFANEPGVMMLGSYSRTRRTRQRMRIPLEVLNRKESEAIIK